MADDNVENNLLSEIKVVKPNGKSGTRTKQFFERASPIDELLENKHMKAVCGIIVALLIVLVGHGAACKYFYKGEIDFGQKLLADQFETFHNFFIIWIPMFLSQFLVYYGLKCWASVRVNLPVKSTKMKLWDYFWLGITVTYYPGSVCLATWLVLKLDMSFVLLFATHVNVCMVVMKMHAFIRSNVPRALSYAPNDGKQTPCPDFSQFWYFLSAPILIYRDSYPRTKAIRWSYVASNAIAFVLLIFAILPILEKCSIDNFKYSGVKPYGWIDCCIITLGNVGYGILVAILSNYQLLHAWQNMFAELCKFGDRLFYKDWWTSTDYDEYFRTWNVIVNNWLHTYVYKDFYDIVAPGNRLVAKYATFFVSALFHEYIILFTLKFFLPILSLQFLTLGFILSYLKIKPSIIGSTFMFLSIGAGVSIGLTFYTIEYYARLNCPIQNPTVISYIIPRFITCNND